MSSVYVVTRCLKNVNVNVGLSVLFRPCLIYTCFTFICTCKLHLILFFCSRNEYSQAEKNTIIIENLPLTLVKRVQVGIEEGK